jgi:NAD(P)-dependent dehydrogenase (short-subunit alcohol dehydrogenase family)
MEIWQETLLMTDRTISATETHRRFDSRVVLVTGGSSGIGLALARRVVEEGGAVVIGARGVDKGEAAAREFGAHFVRADVTEEADAAALVDAALDRYGRLDGAFNNAGGVAAGGPLPDLDAADWHAELALNLTSVFYSMKHEIAAMADGGSVVNNASTGGVAGIPGLAPYVAAKHGVVGLTKSAALAHAEQGVRVNAIVTGNVDTPLYRRLLGAPGDAERADLDAPNPSGRVAGPEEVAAFVAFLLSDEARFVTGAALAIDGGATAQ